MTDAWSALSVALAIGAQQPSTVEPIDQVLTIEWRHKQVRPGDGAVIFSGGVVARYGPTTLKAEKLTLYQSDERKEGLAEGHVEIDDPDGVASADQLRFDWLHRTGNGANVTIAVEGLWLRAETLEIEPGEWTLLNVKAAPDGSARPLFGVAAPRVTYRPGAGGTARRAAVSVLGVKLVTIPSYRFGGQREQDGLRLPSISYNQGLGVAWRSSYRVDDRTRISGGFRAKRRDRTAASIELTRSLLPRNEPGTLIPPQSDFGERFYYGYLDSVYVRQPHEEADLLGTRRSSVTLGAAANQTIPARFSTNRHTKPFDLTFEESRPFGNVSVLANLRYQSMLEDGGPNEKRVVFTGVAKAPSLDLGNGLSTLLRVDGSAFWGENQFGWAQVQAGLAYSPAQAVRFGAAVVHASQVGTPTFDVDRLYSTKAFHGRVDLDLGSAKINYLAKFDFERRKWYDNEIWLSFLIGPVEPFITYREFPRTITFGVRLRAEQAFDRLRRRLDNRAPKRL